MKAPPKKKKKVVSCPDVKHGSKEKRRKKKFAMAKLMKGKKGRQACPLLKRVGIAL